MSSRSVEHLREGLPYPPRQVAVLIPGRGLVVLPPETLDASSAIYTEDGSLRVVNGVVYFLADRLGFQSDDSAMSNEWLYESR